MRRADWRAAQSVAALARWRRHAPLTPIAMDTLHGLVASDATLAGTVHNGGQAYLSLTSKHRSFAEHVADIFMACEINVRVTERSIGSGTYWTAKTLSYSGLGDAWREWYPRGRKELLQFAVTPISLLYWYLGDGSLKRRIGRSVSVSAQLGTYAFSVESLREMAMSIEIAIGCVVGGVRIYITKAGPIVALTNSATRTFLEYIGPSPLTEFDYKWDLSFPGPGE